MNLRGFFLAFLFATLFAAGQDAVQNLEALNRKFGAQYKTGQYADAVVTLDQMLAAPETSAIPGARGEVLYNKACVLALLKQKSAAIRTIRESLSAGYTNWISYSRDRDFDSLRKDADFLALLAQIKQQYGPKPLIWDVSQVAPEFPLRFDDLQSPELAELRSEFQIDKVAAGSKDDYDRLIRLAVWTSRQWEHDPNHMASKSDPITILREARAGGRFICQNYAMVLAGAARSCGFYARHLAILPADVETRSEAHSVVDVWMPAFRKWVLADAQFGIVPELNGAPLSGLELQKAIAEDAPIRCRGNESDCAAWQSFIIPNLYYFKISDDQRRFGGQVSRQLVLVPKGAKEPHKFAGGNEGVFAGAIYTGNPASFNAPPGTTLWQKNP